MTSTAAASRRPHTVSYPGSTAWLWVIVLGLFFGVVDHGVWCGRTNTAGLPSFSTEVSPVGPGGGGGLCWSGSVWWGVGGGEQGGEGVLVWPVGGQVEGDVAGSPGDPGGHGDQLTAQGGGAGFGVKQAGQASGGAGEVVGDGGQRQPGRVRGKRSSRAYGPGAESLRSALTCSMIACSRCCFSACTSSTTESVINAW
jgi:hypothetical protein